MKKPLGGVYRIQGLTILESIVAMASGALLFVGIGSFIQLFGKGMKQVKDLGDYTVLKGTLTRQLMEMNGGRCRQYFQFGVYPPNRSSPIPVTLLKTPIPNGSPIPPDAILFNSDGSSRINGIQYRILLTTIDPACFDDYRDSCRGSLSLEMTRSGEQTLSNGVVVQSQSLSKGPIIQSQTLVDLTYNLDVTRTTFAGCEQINTPMPGEISTDPGDGCQYPPAFPSAVVPVGGHQVQVSCHAGYAVLGVCSAGMTPSPMPAVASPTPTPPQIYQPSYCIPTDKTKFTQLGCCPLQDPAQIQGTPVWRDTTCNIDASEIVTGVCSTNPNPGASDYSGTDPYPKWKTDMCPQSVQCSVIKDTKLHNINYLKYFCYNTPIVGGEMTSCDYREVMVEYCDAVRCPWDPHIRCCRITKPR